MKITLIICTKNEEATIGEIIRQAKPYVDELLVVDGHSIDTTREVAHNFGAKVILDFGKGKGDGIKAGIKHAAGDIFVFMDADGSHDIVDIPRLVEPIRSDAADLVIGSRIRGGSDEFSGTFDNIIRTLGSLIVSYIIARRWDVVLTDCNNGFRAVRGSAARKLDLRRDDFVIEQEMVIECAKKGFRILEIASHEFGRKAGQSKLKTSQGWKFISHFFKEIVKNFLP